MKLIMLPPVDTPKSGPLMPKKLNFHHEKYKPVFQHIPITIRVIVIGSKKFLLFPSVYDLIISKTPFRIPSL
jgi:hypothetical protein